MPTADDEYDALPLEASRSPYENFPVLSVVVARPLRQGFAAVYSFCRASDDIADDPSRTASQRLDALCRWRDELDRCFAGRPRLPMYARLHRSIARYGLDAEPFHRLLNAFEEDQVRTEYQTWSELQSYAASSANPVGELVLRIAGHHPDDTDWPRLLALSDKTCSALQFVNFWQDVRRDLLELDRVYIPLAEVGTSAANLREMASTGATPESAVAFRCILQPLVERTDALMRESLDLPSRVHPCLARPLRLFQQAGLLVSARIRARGYGTLWRRPRVSRLSLVVLSLGAWLRPIGRPT